MRRLTILLLAALLCACSGDKPGEDATAQTPSRMAEKNQRQRTAASAGTVHAQQKANASMPEHNAKDGQNQQGEDPKPPTAQELARADKIIAYHNDAQIKLERGLLADQLMANTQIYRQYWQLPKRPKAPRKAGLAPGKGLFDDAEAQAVTAALTDMDRTLGEMLKHYDQLEKYVSDASIKDDGKKGKELANAIGEAYGRHMGARRSWLGTVEKAAARAEAVLLHDHPLRRQILLASQIFAQFREVADLLATDAPETTMLQACADNITRLLADAGRPPFLAKPALERDYRDFLRQVALYAATLERGIAEGLHAVQRRELNAAAIQSRSAYNAFVAAVNRGI